MWTWKTREYFCNKKLKEFEILIFQEFSCGNAFLRLKGSTRSFFFKIYISNKKWKSQEKRRWHIAKCCFWFFKCSNLWHSYMVNDKERNLIYLYFLPHFSLFCRCFKLNRKQFLLHNTEMSKKMFLRMVKCMFVFSVTISLIQKPTEHLKALFPFWISLLFFFVLMYQTLFLEEQFSILLER